MNEAERYKGIEERVESFYNSRMELFRHLIGERTLELSEEILKILKTAKLTYEEAYGILQFVVDSLEYERTFIHIDIVKPSDTRPLMEGQKVAQDQWKAQLGRK